MFAHGFGGVSGCDGKISGAPLGSHSALVILPGAGGKVL